MKNVALILASGTGSRCGLDYPKQFAQIGEKCILQRTVEKFENNSKIDEIYLVTNSEYVDKVKEITKSYSKIKKVLAGGKTRKDSSYNGIFGIDYDECNVLIHDGVRPLVAEEIINNCIEELDKYSAVCVAIDSTDTVYIAPDGFIEEIPQRTTIKRAQTPQAFKLSLIKKAHLMANEDEACAVTDDCGLVNYFKLAKIRIINGSEKNIKITYPEDLEFAKKYL